MAYPQGIDFRATLGFVTDPANYNFEPDPGGTTPSYPRTTPQGNTVGWETLTNAPAFRDRNAGNDARIAGGVLMGAADADVYRFDLPATGNYNIGLGAGDAVYTAVVGVSLFDTNSSLGALTTGSTSASQRFKDANNIEYTNVTWPTTQATILKTFATTICRFKPVASSEMANFYVASAATPSSGSGIGGRAGGGGKIGLGALWPLWGLEWLRKRKNMLKRSMLLFVILLGLCMAVRGQSIPQSSPVTLNAGSGTCVPVLPGNTTAGNNLFVFAQWASTSITASIADTLTNTYIVPALPDLPSTPAWAYTNTSGVFRVAGWLVNRGIGGADTITVTFSGSVKNACVAVEASGLTYSPQEGAVSANYGGSQTAAMSVGPVAALRAPKQLSLCFGGDETNNDTVTAGGSYNVLQQAAGGGQYFFVMNQNLTSAAGTTPSCTGTASSGSNKWMLTMVTLDASLAYHSLPQAPLTVPTVTMPSTVGYTQATVCPSSCTYSSLATALSSVSCATVLTLTAGTTYTLNAYNLPTHSCDETHWIIVQSSQLANLPASGTRINPSNLSNMPTVTSGTDFAIIDNSGQGVVAIDHYRFVGINFAFTANDNNETYLLYLGSGAVNDTSNRIIVDRCIVQGQPLFANKYGLQINAANSAVVDSYITEMHGLNGIWGDAAALSVGGHGEAGYLIQNNFLSASGHDLVFGGGGTGNVTDITITKNWFWKNPCWLPTQGCYVGPHWAAKTQLEFKLGTRVSVTGNVFDYEWLDTEPGYASINIVPSTSENPGAYDDDILIQNNLFRHSFAVYRNAGYSTADANWVLSTMGVASHRVVVYNNLFDDIGGWGAQSPNFQIITSGSEIDEQIYHNTFVSNVSIDNSMSVGFKTFSGCDFADNILNYGNYGVNGGNGEGFGKAVLDTVCYDYKFGNTALVGGLNGVTYPTGTLAPTDWTNAAGGVRFVNYNGGSGGDYRLCTGVNAPAAPCPGASILHNAASDSIDVGANVSNVLAATTGVLSGIITGSTFTSGNQMTSGVSIK